MGIKYKRLSESEKESFRKLLKNLLPLKTQASTLGKEKGSPNILICVFCFNNRR